MKNKQEKALDRLRDDEIFVDVAAWNHDGGTAGGVAFSWMCTMEAAELLLIGG